MLKIGSADMNKIIRAVNAGKENPFSNRPECVKFYNNLIAEKKENEKKYPDVPCLFALVEPDEDEEDALMKLLPDN